MEQHIIEISGGVARNPLIHFSHPVSAAIGQGEHLAIVGPNGSGKSLFVDLLLGKYPLKEGRLTYDFSPSLSDSVYDHIKYLSFRDTYGPADASYYYQQRWNSTEQDDVPTVREMLGAINDEALCRHLFQLFDLEPLMDKKIILLSSGELRKFQLIKALITAPRILIVDNPFIGLDAEARELLKVLLEELSTLEHLQIVLVLSVPADIPSFITHVIEVLPGRKVEPKVDRNTYVKTIAEHNDCQPYGESDVKLPVGVPDKHVPALEQEIVRMNRVSIRYGNRTILDRLDWVVREGEKWILSGGNGSGKSTLLSLICADNPQSYACDISLFGRKRGTGESIWDIKKRIGYVSPEMHRAYLKNIPAIEVVASGLNDSIGLYRRPQPDDLLICEKWMDVFGIAGLKDRPFLQLSSGEQRLALLTRAFVKDPELLILDEPLHGLDAYNRKKVKRIIEVFSSRPGKTLVMVTHYREEWPQVTTHHLQLVKHAGGEAPQPMLYAER